MNQHEMLQTVCDQIKEIADRSRRTETAVHKLREHMGIAGPAAQVSVLGPNDVEVQGYDVTLSQIRKRLVASDAYSACDRITVRDSSGIIAVITMLA